jgi:uncharacterized membrane protein YfcA
MITWSLLQIGAIFVLAGAVKGVIGLGLPTVAVGLLGTVMTPAQAAALVIVPSFVTNVWQLLAGPGFLALVRRLRLLLIGLCIGTLAGGWLVPVDNSGRARIALGIALLCYAAVGLFAPRLSVPPRAEWWLSPIFGLATGVVTAMTGVFVVPMVPYIQALGLQRDDLVQALGLSFTVATVALAVVLIGNGQLHLSLAGLSIYALAVSLVGMALGQVVRKRIDPRTFRLCFFIGMMLLGTHLALSSLLKP